MDLKIAIVGLLLGTGGGVLLLNRTSEVQGPMTLLGAASVAASHCTAISVHDGDTFRCDGEKIRIENIDAPELAGSPRCEDRRRETAWCDDGAGIASRDALSAFLDAGPVEVSRSGEDRYGRTLATVSVNGRDAGEYLVSMGLARQWR